MTTAFEALSNAYDVNVSGIKSSFPGETKALLAATTITTDGTVDNAPVLIIEQHKVATVILTVSGKVADVGTTLDIYLQYSPDGGTSWDDLAHFTQMTDAVLGNGKYIVFLTREVASGIADRALTDGALAANSVRNISWCDRIRVKTVAANFAGADTVTIQVDGFFQR